MNTEELAQKVNARTWFHRIDLGNGIITPGADDSPWKLQHIHMPEDLTGKRVIDIGAYDGFFSFEAERRGASHVLATDYFCWTLPRGHIGDGEGFRIAHQALGSKVEPRYIRAEDLCRKRWASPIWYCSWACCITRPIHCSICARPVRSAAT